MDKLFKHKDIIRDIRSNDFNFSKDSIMESKKGDDYWLTFGDNPQFSYLYQLEEDRNHDKDLLLEIDFDK